MDQKREALLIFRGAYGRLCVLMAQALADGYHENAVQLASRGGGHSKDRTLHSIRKARAVVALGLEAARGHGNDTADIVAAGRQAKHAAEEEWNVHLRIASVS